MDRAPPKPARRVQPAGLLALAVVILGAVLRFWAVSRAPPNPFYDAAVRSMGLSWHNFFFGALDPGGEVSIDKPPADLWLQVMATKVLGFGRLALHLPEALGGSLAVALLYGAVRSVWGTRAGILAALSLAVLPISVLTSRSDTMDSVLAALLIASLWASVRALKTRRAVWVVAAAALLGIAFNVKLSEALVPLPGLALMWWMTAGPRRRIPLLLGAGVTLVAIAMAWILVASLTPAGHRPYPIGSGTGSIYRVVFVYNGLDRLRGAPQLGPTDPTQPGPLRLVASHADYSHLIGTELIGALALALGLGLVKARRRRGRPAADGSSRRDRPPPRPRSSPPSAGDTPDGGGPGSNAASEHVARWSSRGLGLWLVAALVLFSSLGHLQSRYLEAGTPALAAALGVSAAGLLAGAFAGDHAIRALAAALTVSGLYAVSMAGDSLGRAAAGLDLALALSLLAVLRQPARHPGAGRRRWTGTTLSALAAVALLAPPMRSSLDIVARNAGDAPQVGSGAQYSAFLRAHRDGARYEVASSDPLGVVGLIAVDAQPVLILNDVKGPLVRLATLEELVRRGAVHYVLLSHPCSSGRRCPSTTRWSLRHAIRIYGDLYRFTTAGLAVPRRASACERATKATSCVASPPHRLLERLYDPAQPVCFA